MKKNELIPENEFVEENEASPNLRDDDFSIRSSDSEYLNQQEHNSDHGLSASKEQGDPQPPDSNPQDLQKEECLDAAVQDNESAGPQEPFEESNSVKSCLFQNSFSPATGLYMIEATCSVKNYQFTMGDRGDISRNLCPMVTELVIINTVQRNGRYSVLVIGVLVESQQQFFSALQRINSLLRMKGFQFAPMANTRDTLRNVAKTKVIPKVDANGMYQLTIKFSLPKGSKEEKSGTEAALGRRLEKMVRNCGVEKISFGPGERILQLGHVEDILRAQAKIKSEYEVSQSKHVWRNLAIKEKEKERKKERKMKARALNKSENQNSNISESKKTEASKDVLKGRELMKRSLLSNPYMMTLTLSVSDEEGESLETCHHKLIKNGKTLDSQHSASNDPSHCEMKSPLHREENKMQPETFMNDLVEEESSKNFLMEEINRSFNVKRLREKRECLSNSYSTDISEIEVEEFEMFEKLIDADEDDIGKTVHSHPIMNTPALANIEIEQEDKLEKVRKEDSVMIFLGIGNKDIEAVQEDADWFGSVINFSTTKRAACLWDIIVKFETREEMEAAYFGLRDKYSNIEITSSDKEDLDGVKIFDMRDGLDKIKANAESAVRNSEKGEHIPGLSTDDGE